MGRDVVAAAREEVDAWLGLAAGGRVRSKGKGAAGDKL